MSQLQTFHVERISNMNYFAIMKWKSLRTSQWKATQLQQTLMIKDIFFWLMENKDNS